METSNIVIAVFLAASTLVGSMILLVLQVIRKTVSRLETNLTMSLQHLSDEFLKLKTEHDIMKQNCMKN